MPVRGQEAERGVFFVLDEGRSFAERQVDRAGVVVGHAAVSLRNARLFEQVKRAARTDPLTGLLNRLASCDARLVLVNLEDLWGETHGQNVPGTVHEHPNWSNRCRHALEAIPEVPGLLDTLREIDRRRRR